MSSSASEAAFTAAVVQLRSTTDVEMNEQRAVQIIEAARRAGAQLIALPENWFFIGPLDEKAKLAEPIEGPRVERMASLARRLDVHLLLGSVAETCSEPGRCFNTSVLLGPDGAVLSTYRKIHLFDVAIPDGPTFRESATVAPGASPVTVETSLATLGLSVCYDLRFPELYRILANSGAQVLTVPSAFTQFTGKDHWEVLLRARAIENGCWVMAPGQWGAHSRERASYGRSVIIDPWGTVVACCSDQEGFAVARIDLAYLGKIRTELPSLSHQRLDRDSS